MTVYAPFMLARPFDDEGAGKMFAGLDDKAASPAEPSSAPVISAGQALPLMLARPFDDVKGDALLAPAGQPARANPVAQTAQGSLTPA